MSSKPPKYVTDSPSKIIQYVQHGYHTFIGSDEHSKCEHFILELMDALDECSIERVRGCQAVTRRDFAVLLVEACQRLVKGIGGRFQPSLSGIAPSLEEAMLAFCAANRQGFLILSDIDPAIRMQRTIEFEGPLRSVMQLHDDVAVILIGSNDVISEMVGDYDRPFYMSFRVFTL